MENLPLRLVAPLLTVVTVLVAGCSDYRGVNEKNPYYQKAEAARQRDDYKAAAGFYRECLKFSPDSSKAHLQLGILCEEQHKDYPQAIIHYRAYLTAVGNQNEDVSRMLSRVEKMYMTQLNRKYMKRTKAEPVSNAPFVRPQAVLHRPVSADVTPSNDRTIVASQEKTYVVQEGDNLGGISNKVYGTSKHWNMIFEANRGLLPSPEKLKVGQRLTIPVIN